MVTSGIYQIRNQLNGKRYIGSSVNLRKRWYVHLSRLRSGQHPNPYLQAAFRKYGETAFEFSVLEHANPENLIEHEQHYLDTLGPEYNIAPTAGSCLGCRRSPETRRKISEALRGHTVTQETRQKISEGHRGERNWNYGKARSAETKRKISEAMSGDRNPNYGKHPSEQTRAKLSEARRGDRNHNYGKSFTEQHRRNLSIAQKARWRRIHAMQRKNDSV